jgi:hypothetical protein
MATKHHPKPVVLNPNYCRIGEPPLSGQTALPIANSYRYLNNWSQIGQLYSAQQGIDATYGDDVATTENGSYYVILPGSNKADTNNQIRELEGCLVPWFCEPTIGTPPAGYTQLVTVTWQQSGGSVQTLYESAETIDSGNTVNQKGFILKSSRTGGGFQYDPQNDGSWTYGILTTKGIHTATLGIWAAPNRSLSESQAVVTDANLALGEVIRGSTGTAGRGSVGDFIRRVGADLDSDDGLFQNACPCVWQWGHSHGTHTSTNSYQMVGGTGNEFQLRVPKLTPDSTIGLYPTAFITTSGASGGDPAYLKLTAEDLGGGADTWILEITTDTATLYDYTDASNDTLLCAVDSPTKFTVEIMAPSSGYIILHTLAIWARLWEV